MTFKQYLEEMAGTFGLVSCKDRKNPNFQIWGAMSDLKCKSKKGKNSILKMKFNGDKENSDGKRKKQ